MQPNDLERRPEAAELRWEIDVPIFKDPLIRRQLGLALGIPFGLLALFLFVLSFSDRGALYGIGLLALLFFVGWIFIRLVYKGVYQVEFHLGQTSLTCRTRAAQAKTNRLVNGLAVLLGLLTGKPAAAGAGLLAQSRQTVTLRWDRIRRVRRYPRQHTFLLRAGYLESVAIFCHEENHRAVEQWIDARVKPTEE